MNMNNETPAKHTFSFKNWDYDFTLSKDCTGQETKNSENWAFNEKVTWYYPLQHAYKYY